MKTFIISTSQVGYLAKRIKRKLKGFEIIFPAKNVGGKRYFPNGEVYIKISKPETLKNKRVIVLHSGAPKPNEGLIELELILQILRDNKLKPEIFFTYFPYGMQDKVFEKGETNVAENLIKKLINYYKVKKIYLIDPHFGGRKWVEKYPIISISAVPILIEKAKEDFGENILFLSPDIGGKRRTKISGIKKKRIDSQRVKMALPRINLKDKVVGIVDDLLETGGTLLSSYDECKKCRAKKILALVTHGVLPLGISKIKKKFSKLYLTNTIKQKMTNVDITDLILKAISKYG